MVKARTYFTDRLVASLAKELHSPAAMFGTRDRFIFLRLGQWFGLVMTEVWLFSV
jgi:hypothetical protein